MEKLRSMKLNIESEQKTAATAGTTTVARSRDMMPMASRFSSPVLSSTLLRRKPHRLKLEEKNKLLAKMSELDGLTRISNHRALVERLKSETERSDQKQTPLAIRYFRH